MKIVVNDVKTGNSFQREIDKTKVAQVFGKKIGDKIEGGIVGLAGYTLVVTGGSSKDGVPMRPEVVGPRKLRALISGGVGVRGLKKGQRVKKMVV